MNNPYNTGPSQQMCQDCTNRSTKILATSTQEILENLIRSWQDMAKKTCQDQLRDKIWSNMTVYFFSQYVAGLLMHYLVKILQDLG